VWNCRVAGGATRRGVKPLRPAGFLYRLRAPGRRTPIKSRYRATRAMRKLVADFSAQGKRLANPIAIVSFVSLEELVSNGGRFFHQGALAATLTHPHPPQPLFCFFFHFLQGLLLSHASVPITLFPSPLLPLSAYSPTPCPNSLVARRFSLANQKPRGSAGPHVCRFLPLEGQTGDRTSNTRGVLNYDGGNRAGMARHRGRCGFPSP